MDFSKRARYENIMLMLSGYMAWAAVALGTVMWTAPTAAVRWMSVALLMVFAVAMALMPDRAPPLRGPLLYVGLQSAAAVGLILLNHEDWSLHTILLYLMSAHAMILLPERLAFLVITGYALVITGISIAEWGFPGGLYLLGAYVGVLYFFGLFARSLGREAEARKDSQRLLRELQEAHTQLQEYAAQAEEMAVVEERSRLAREMHDTLGHHLTVAAVQLEGAQRLIPTDPGRAAEIVETVRQQVRGGLQELRQAVATLRAPLEADLQLRGSLRRLAQSFEEATGVTVHRTLPEEVPPLSAVQRIALYRAAQEALTNVQRHASATHAWLTLMVQNQQVVLLVSDDGIGFPKALTGEAGFGLRGLRERVAQLGGELTLERRAGGGSQLSVRLPIDAERFDE